MDKNGTDQQPTTHAFHTSNNTNENIHGSVVCTKVDVNVDRFEESVTKAKGKDTTDLISPKANDVENIRLIKGEVVCHYLILKVVIHHCKVER